MLLEQKTILKAGIELISIKDFAAKYAGGVSLPAIDYAMKQDMIDWIQPGRERLIVLTAKTKAYTPNEHPARI